MKILSAERITEEATLLLEQNGFDLTVKEGIHGHDLPELINEEGFEILIPGTEMVIDQDILDDCPGLKVIALTDWDHHRVDTNYAEEVGIQILVPESASARSVAELVFAHFFTLARSLQVFNRRMPLEGDTGFVEIRESVPLGLVLQGSTLAILGMDSVGMELAQMGFGLGMNVAVWDEEPADYKVEMKLAQNQKVEFDLKVSENLEQVLNAADFVVVNYEALPGAALLTEKNLQSLKDGVVLVNAKSNAALDEEALLRGLSTGKIAGAGLDTFADEPQPHLSVLMNENISLSPKIADDTRQAVENTDKNIVEQLLKLKID